MMRSQRPVRLCPVEFACTLASALLLSGCASHTAGIPSVAPYQESSASQGSFGNASEFAGAKLASGKIQHVVVVMQENRSFDDLFYGYPGANTATSGKNHKGQTIQLQPVPLEAPWGIDHESKDFFQACNGDLGRHCKMNGFDLEQTFGSGQPANLPYSYVPHSETKPYFDIAHQYVLADDMFTSNLDESFESHQYIIAGQANHAVDQPNGQEGCGQASATVRTLLENRHYGPDESPCFTYSTIGSELDARGLPWRFYASATGQVAYIWSAYQAISQVYNGPEWKANVINPQTKFLKDVAGGHLATVTWITPTCNTSDHASCLSNRGPDWVASIVNAVGQSKFWDSTAIFVMWDEWGGWYDHVPPPYEDYDGLGIRVPLLIVSAYAKKGHVSHVQYEHGSILRFIEDAFGLPRLAASDARANSPGPDCFDFTKPPRTFVPIKTTLTARDFIDAPLDPRPPDES